MKIKTNKGLDLELTPEELRHFKINNAEELTKFVNILETKTNMGFKKDDKKSDDS